MSAPKTRLKERVKAAEVPAVPAPPDGPGALLQPRAVLAAVQSARAGGGAEQPPPLARARALPVDLGLQPRRVLHGAGGRPLRPGRRRRHAGEPGRADACPAAGRDQPLRRRPRQRPAGALCGAAGRDGGRRHPHRRAQGAAAARARMARPAVHIPVPADPDAACRRPVAPVPVHPERRHHGRRGAEARARRHHHARAAADPDAARALHPPAAGRGRARGRGDADPLHPHRVGDRHVPVAPVSGLPGAQPRRLPGAARQ